LWAALGLSGIAVAAVWLWLHSVLKEWTPGIAVSALVLAASITVIPAIMRRQANARIRPRVERVLVDTHNSLIFLVEDILIDSARSRLDPFDISNDLHETLNRLAWEYMTSKISSESVPGFVLTARQFAGQLAQTRERERDVLEPGLIRAIDDFRRTIQRAGHEYEATPDDLIADPAGQATFSVLEGVRRFAWAFQSYLPYKLEIGEDTRELANGITRASNHGEGA
jgi:hypothetical protein